MANQSQGLLGFGSNDPLSTGLNNTQATNAFNFSSNPDTRLSGLNSGATPGLGILDFAGGGNATPGGGGFLDSLNLGNIGAGVGILGDILGAYTAMKQFGLAERGLNHQIGLDEANLGNQAKLGQQRLDLQSQLRQHERPDLFQGQHNTQLQQTIGETP